MYEKIKNYLAERFITPPKPRSKFVKALMESPRRNRPSQHRPRMRTRAEGPYAPAGGRVTHSRGTSTTGTGERPGAQGTRVADDTVNTLRRRRKAPARRPAGEEQQKALKAWTEYQRIGSILAEVGGTPTKAGREKWLKRARPRPGSDFKPGEGPQDPRDMTPAQRAELERKTARIRAHRDAERKQVQH